MTLRFELEKPNVLLAVISGHCDGESFYAEFTQVDAACTGGKANSIAYDLLLSWLGVNTPRIVVLDMCMSREFHTRMVNQELHQQNCMPGRRGDDHCQGI